MVSRSSRTRPHNGWWRAPSAPRRWPDSRPGHAPAGGLNDGGVLPPAK